MGKSKGGRSLNPADAARKKTRLREKEKNAARRRETRESTLSKKDSDSLKSELQQLIRSEETGAKLDSKQLARRKAIQTVLKEQEIQEKAALEEAKSSSASSSSSAHPTAAAMAMIPPPHPAHNFQQFYPLQQHPGMLHAPPFHPYHSNPHPYPVSHPPAAPPPLPPHFHLKREPISLNLEEIPPPPSHAGLDRIYSHEGQQPAPPGLSDPSASKTKVEPIAAETAEAPTIPEDEEHLADKNESGGLLLQDYNDIDDAPPPAYATSSEAQTVAAVSSAQSTQPNPTTASPHVDASIVALVPASVKRRKIMAPVGVASKPSQVSATSSEPATAAPASTDDYSSWLKDMEALGAV